MNPISYAQLTMIQRCGEQYRRRYIEKERLAPAAAMIRGTGQHKAQHLDLDEKRKTGALLPLDAVKDAARDAVTVAFADGVALNDDEKDRGLTVVKAETIDSAVRLSELHHDAVAPDILPKYLEVKANVRVPGIEPELVGFIDVVENDGTLIDTKNSGKSPQADAAEKSDQLTWYAMSYKAATGQDSPKQRLDYLVDTKLPKYVPLTVQNTDADFVPLVNRIKQAVTTIQAGMFLPANPDSWWCSARWCGYHATCPYVKNRTSIVVPAISAGLEE